MKKVWLATALVMAQAAAVNVYAQGMDGAKKAPTPTVQANGEKGTAPAAPNTAMDKAGSTSMPAKSGATPDRVMAPTPTTEANGEKARAPATRNAAGSDMSPGAAKRGSAAERKPAPTPSTEANGEKADKKGGVGEMKSTAPAK